MAYYSSDYGKAFRNRALTLLTNPVWPVYNVYNRNKTSEDRFIVFKVTDVGTPVYTGNNKQVHGIDTPTIMISFYAKDVSECEAAYKIIADFFHGYMGQLASDTSSLGSAITAKCSVHHIDTEFDDDTSLFHLEAEIDLFVVTPL